MNLHRCNHEISEEGMFGVKDQDDLITETLNPSPCFKWKHMLIQYNDTFQHFPHRSLTIISLV